MRPAEEKCSSVVRSFVTEVICGGIWQMGSQRRSSIVPGARKSVAYKRSNVMFLVDRLSASFLVLLLSSQFYPALGRPINNDHHRHGHGIYGALNEQDQIDGTTYLMNFGYLPGSDLETGALRTDEELQRAIRHFQKFAHIPETGRLDESTVEAMKKPRCGMADLIQGHGHHRHTDGEVGPPSGYTLGPSKWQKKWLTVRILNFTPDLNYQHTRDAIIRALYVWSDVAQLSFHEVQSGHADIYIQFSSGYHQDGYPFDGPGMILAHAFFPGDERGGDIHFDEDERWTIRSDQGVNLFMVAAHELGHSLGLAHSNVPGSLMFPWHQGYTSDFKLHPDDVTAIQYLYGQKVPPQQPPSNPRPTESTHRPPNPNPVPTHRPHHPHHPVTPVPTPREPASSSTTFRHTTARSTTQSTRSTTTTRTAAVSPVAPKVTTPPRRREGDDGRPTTTRPTYDGGAPSAIPDPCHSIDALSVIRGETFLFSGKWFWRISDRGIMDGFPVEIARFWYGFPPQVEKVDALFERSSDGRIIFFSGKKYWVFNGNHLEGGASAEAGKPISDFGLPEDIDRIDAAFVWSHNRRTYIIVGDMYWKLNDSAHGIETYNYPRDMSMWTGVPLPVDAAFTHTDGHTYFFQGSNFWQFNNARMHVRHGYPRFVGDKWMKCESRNGSARTEIVETATKALVTGSSATTNPIVPSSVALTLTLLLSRVLN